MALTHPSRIRRFNAWLQAPEDGACLAVFRVAFGFAMACDAARYIANGWAWTHYTEGDFLFKYFGFEWVEPLGPLGMFAVHAAMVVAGILIGLGAFYRAATVVYFLAHTYAFLLASEHYLNHAYLISTVAFMLIWLPANRFLAVDAWRDPELGALPTPRWARFTLEAQVAIVYTFGAIAKMNADWLAGVPVAQWLQHSAEDLPWGGQLLSEPAVVPIIVWGGLLFDLLIVPALLWRRTRALAIVISLGFHLSNHVLFEIGVFPWMMLGATTLFFAADWPRRVPILRSIVNDWTPRSPGADRAATGAEPAASVDLARVGKGMVVVPIGIWLAIQTLVPLRHHLYPGDVAWTEEGHLFSWRMKLRSKRGRATFRVLDPATDQEWRVYPEDELSKRQAQKMAGRPDLILQYAHHIAELEGERLGHPVEVRADVFVSLNYRTPQRMIDPQRDLAQVEPSLLAADWILPFERTEVPLPHARSQDADE